MSKPKTGLEAQSADTGRPFGTEPRRSSGPLYLILGLFLVWVGVLLYIATTQVGLKQ